MIGDRPRLIGGLGLICLTASAAAQMPPPDKVFVNGNIYTLVASRPRVEAIALAGDRIVATGSNGEIRSIVQAATRTVDLRGRTVLPGLIDAHGHMAALGRFGLGRIDLSDAKSFDDVVRIIADRVGAAQPGEWIVGGRWDHESWPDKKLPSHHKLSAVSANNPVWLLRVDGHAGLANAAAMKLAGVGRETAPPAGGAILRDGNGDPSGIFLDNAEALIASHVKGPSTDPAKVILKAQEMCLSVGLTGVHDAGISPAEIDVYRALADSGALKLRIYGMVNGSSAIEYFSKNQPIIGDVFTVRSCKLHIDGAMGSRGAWLIFPYSDKPTDENGKPYTGLAVNPPEFIRKVCEHALRKGYQVCTHAIGDRGNRAVLNTYALALSRRPTQDHRFRIEHAQLLSPEDMPRLARKGVIASMQPTHCTSDMRWIERRIGERRARGAYAWASLLRSGARIAAGSDFPVESHNPFFGLHAAVTRQDRDGQPPGGWRAEQRMTRAEALRAFTLGAAYAAFEENEKGSLEPGKLADFIVIDRDVMTCPPQDIWSTKVLQTYVGGVSVYRSE